MTVQQPLPVQHPSVWTATQQNCKPEEWCYTLSLTDLAEIDAALQHVQTKGLALMVCLATTPLELSNVVVASLARYTLLHSAVYHLAECDAS